jgi:diguanylate cyclase (GGDEF)-like protein
MLTMLPAVDLIRSFVAEPVSVPVPDDAAIDAVLAEGGLTQETALDCGACGWPTCRAHAAAIYNAESSWDLCLPLQRRLLREHAASLAETQTLDPATGLWNTRSFGDRLAVEIARLNRYGSPVCVALIDVDGLDAVRGANDGSEGDEVLRAIGGRFNACLRATDVLARWTGDRFAVALSGVNKTEAFAAAEKLRESVSAVAPAGDASGYTQGVKVTISIGVASAPRGADARDVLESADAALLEAMRAGGDQVRLAPG